MATLSQKLNEEATTSTPLRRSLSLDQLYGLSEQQLQPTALLQRKNTPRTIVTSPTLPSPLVPVSPAFSKIPSPIFDACLARPRREDATSSPVTTVHTVVRHSEVGAWRSRRSGSTCRRSDNSSGPTDAGLQSPHAISNRSSSESGKTTGGSRLIQDKNSLRRVQGVMIAARVTGVSSARSSTSEVRLSQRGSAHVNKG